MSLDTTTAAPADPGPQSLDNVPAVDTKPLPAEGNQPPGEADAVNPQDAKKTAFSERISQVVADRKEAQAAAAQARAEAASANARADAVEAQLRKLSQIDRSQLDFGQLNRLDIHEALQEQRLMEDRSRAKQAAQAAYDRRADAFALSVENARELLPDMDQAMDSFFSIPFGDEAADIIADSPLSAQIAHYLGKNPKEARSILSLSPVRQAAAIARLEGRLSTSSNSRKASGAPAPVTTVSGVASVTSKSANEMSMDEYVAARKSRKI